MEEAVIVSAVRTPIGRFGGGLSEVSAVDLGAVVIEEVVRRAGVESGDVDEVIMGNVLMAGQGMNPARQSLVKAGLPVQVPAMTINKVCGSGLKAVASGSPVHPVGRGGSRRGRGNGEYEPSAVHCPARSVRISHGAWGASRLHD